MDTKPLFYFFPKLEHVADSSLQSGRFCYYPPSREKKELEKLNDLWLTYPQISRNLNPNHPFPQNFDVGKIREGFNEIRIIISNVRVILDSYKVLKREPTEREKEFLAKKIANKVLMFSIYAKENEEGVEPLQGVIVLEVGLKHEVINGKNIYKFVGETRTVIDPNNQSKGVATEAKQAICKYAFEELELDEIYSSVLATNIANIKVNLRNKFKPNGFSIVYDKDDKEKENPKGVLLNFNLINEKRENNNNQSTAPEVEKTEEVQSEHPIIIFHFDTDKEEETKEELEKRKEEWEKAKNEEIKAILESGFKPNGYEIIDKEKVLLHFAPTKE